MLRSMPSLPRASCRRCCRCPDRAGWSFSLLARLPVRWRRLPSAIILTCLVSRRRGLSGIAVARHGYGLPLRRLEAHGAGHPVPDQAGLDATSRLMAIAGECGADDLAICLLSGGASANLIAPAGAITLAEKQALTRALLRAGVAIDEIDIVRKHISRVKGGRLARMIAPARMVTLALSDAPGDDPRRSGPGQTIPDPRRWPKRAPFSRGSGSKHRQAFAPPWQTPKTRRQSPVMLLLPRPRRMSRPGRAMRSTPRRPWLNALGYSVDVLGEELEGEAREVAAHHADLARTAIKAGGKRRAAFGR